MNYANFYLSRVLALAAISILLMGIQTTGAWLQQRRDRPGYERLGALVSDGGKFKTEWWPWPPQIDLSGQYQGRPFRYEKASLKMSHLLLECLPAAAMDLSRRRPGKHSFGLLAADLDRLFPGWQALYASTAAVPWKKRSIDHRPLGFGSGPGIDLYRQNPAPFEEAILRSDLQGLLTYCSESPVNPR